MPVLKELLETVPAVGRVEWIGLAPARRAPIEPQSEVVVELNTGIQGEHHAGYLGNGVPRRAALPGDEPMELNTRIERRDKNAVLCADEHDEDSQEAQE